MVADFGPKTVVRPRLDVRVRRVDGRFLVVLADQSYSLSESTAFIWRRADGRRTVEDLARLVATEYDTDFGTALEDTADVLTELGALGLLGLEPDTPASMGEPQ
jgi:hypothetical protein